MKTRTTLCMIALLLLSTGAAPLEIGARAPDFKLPGVDGKDHTLAEYAKAEILIIAFTCNHCPTAQAYEDRLIRLTADYKDKNVCLVAISPNDPKGLRLDELGYTEMGDTLEEMVIRAKDKKFNFPYLYDGDVQAVSKAYGPTATPQLFIFDKARKLRYVGRIDDAKKTGTVTTRDARNAIEAMLAGKPVPVARTKASGCSIKWSDKRGAVLEALERWAGEEVSLENIDLDGVKTLLKNETEKLRLINFWATWCVPCVQEFPELVRIHRMYRKRPFELVTISADDVEQRAKVEAFLKKQQSSAANYLFGSDNVYDLIEAVGNGWQGAFPFTLLLGPKGEVLYKREGMIDPDAVKRAIVDELGRHKYF